MSRTRPIVAPLFGALLTQLRGPTSRGKICLKLTGFGLKLDRSTLLQYERGTVGSPDPRILWGLSQIYRVPIEDLVIELMRDLPAARHVLPKSGAHRLDADQLHIAELVGGVTVKARKVIVGLLELLRDHA